MSHRATVHVFDSHRQVQKAIELLRRAGCHPRKISVISKDCCGTGQSISYCTDAELQKKLAESIAFWCRMWEMLRGDAILRISGIGPILVAGPLARRMIDAWTDLDERNGLSPLHAALVGVHVPSKSVAACEHALKSERFLLVVQDEPEEAAKIERALRRKRPSRQIPVPAELPAAGAFEPPSLGSGL